MAVCNSNGMYHHICHSSSRLAEPQLCQHFVNELHLGYGLANRGRRQAGVALGANNEPEKNRSFSHMKTSKIFLIIFYLISSTMSMESVSCRPTTPLASSITSDRKASSETIF